jgi:hypothetical protein
MNVVLNIRERQLRGVLEELERIGKSVDVAINIEEDGFAVGEESGLKEESGSLTKEELELIQEEMKEKGRANIGA